MGIWLAPNRPWVTSGPLASQFPYYEITFTQQPIRGYGNGELPVELGHSEEFGTAYIIVQEGEEVDYDCLIELAQLRGAIFRGGMGDYFVVQLPGQPIKIYTEEVLEREITQLQKPPCAA